MLVLNISCSLYKTQRYKEQTFMSLLLEINGFGKIAIQEQKPIFVELGVVQLTAVIESLKKYPRIYSKGSSYQLFCLVS